LNKEEEVEENVVDLDKIEMIEKIIMNKLEEESKDIKIEI